MKKVLDFLAGVAFLSWIIFASAVDSESWIPFFILLIDSAYLCFYDWLNNWFEDYETEESTWHTNKDTRTWHKSGT